MHLKMANCMHISFAAIVVDKSHTLDMWLHFWSVLIGQIWQLSVLGGSLWVEWKFEWDHCKLSFFPHPPSFQRELACRLVYKLLSTYCVQNLNPSLRLFKEVLHYSCELVLKNFVIFHITKCQNNCQPSSFS